MLCMSAKLTDIFMLERMNTWVHPTELVAILLLDHTRSAVMEHLLSHNHTADHTNFSVLYKCNSSIDTSIIESLLISKLKPCLNNGTSIALNIFNSSYIVCI